MVKLSFSTNFQGKVSYDAILSRQDAEMRLLELMKKCLTSKVKCDREYAMALSGVTNQGLKIEKSDELNGSSIANTWKTMMEELDSTGKLIKQNADAIETITIDFLNALYSEKKKARKNFQEEYMRINQLLFNISDEVSKKKCEYQKCLESYKLMRTKFEEHYVKGGRGGRKLDEVREKYQKACRKLHLTHNEYVLLLCEAAEFEKDFRTVLLPGLLERQQNTQENSLATWKQLLTDIISASNPTYENIKKMQQKINSSLDSIKPSEEYSGISRSFENEPLEQVMFAFDEDLVEESTIKFSSNQLTVDNLTIDWLRSKLNELELNIKENEEKRATLAAGTQNSSLNGSTSQEHVCGTSSENSESVKGNLEELKCTERKIKKQRDLIKGALNELGCEEVPSVCDFSVENGNCPDEETEEQEQSQTKNSGRNTHNSPNKIVNILMKPFHKKKGPSSPTVPPRGKNRKRSGSQSEGEDQLVTTPSNKSLIEESWFHGVLPREEVVRLLVKRGDFLVRETTRNDESQIVLSVCWDGHKHFIVQTTTEGQFRFEGPAFPSVSELITYQHTSGLPVTNRSGAILKKPIARERWELNNDDVILLDKIGRGNFGDVYRAQLKNNSEIYAVKTCRGTLPEEHKKKFLQEGRILKQYCHKNIVKLIGICVQKQPVMIVMELVSGGSLLTFLRKQGSLLNIGELMSMCMDVVSGMKYLESKNCIHRDLAARNCLIGDDNIVKISDFGMSREEEEYIVSDGMKQIPIKWTAPEALNFGKYTSLCDVWSYGILCWEIFSRGDSPYSGMSNSKAREKIDSGYRMSAPDNTPEEMYRLMLRCWEYKAEDRPNFEQIYTVVETLLATYRTSNS